MKHWFFIIMMTFVYVGAKAFATTAVFDMDWTVLYSISEEQAKIEPESTITYKGKYYRITDYAIDAFELLHRAGINIAFFSAGDQDRNEFVLKVLTERLNKISSEPRSLSRVKNIESLTDTERADGIFRTDASKEELDLGFFQGRYKKDLLKIVSPSELRRTVLVDDDPRYIMNEQVEHLFRITSFNDVLDYVYKLKPERHYPKSTLDWYVERHKLLITVEAIIQAHENPDPKLTLAQQSKQILDIQHKTYATNDSALALQMLDKALMRLDKAGIPINKTSSKRLWKRLQCRHLF